MLQISKSVQHTYAISEHALSRIVELCKPIGDHWRRLFAKAPGESQPPDFDGLCEKLAAKIRSLQRELVVAAVVDQMEPGPLTRQLVLDCQHRLNQCLDQVRSLLILSGYEGDADELHTRRIYFRRIRGLGPGRLEREPASLPKLLQKMIGIEPVAMIEAQLGLQAIAGFPGRPTSPQQQRRKRRRRRRANPGAPTASSRPWRDDDEEE